MTKASPPPMTAQNPGLLRRVLSWRMARRLRRCGAGVQLCSPLKIRGHERIVLGDFVVIREHTWLNCEGDGTTLAIGSRSYLGRFGHINALKSVVIEDDVLIADRVHISDYQHAMSNPDLPVLHQGRTEPQPVLVGTGSWIGVGAVIMPGVTIGAGAVVGANAVVTADVAPFDIVAGAPARVIGSRLGR